MSDSKPSNQANFIELALTCASWQDAQRIADHLLSKQLIAGADFIQLSAKELWKEAVEDNRGVKLIMESVAHYQDEIETEITKMHDREQAILQATPIASSERVMAWLESLASPQEPATG